MGAACGLATLCVYGGSPYGPQEGALRRGTDVVVGTPGRVKDLLEKGSLKLDKVRHACQEPARGMLASHCIEGQPCGLEQNQALGLPCSMCLQSAASNWRQRPMQDRDESLHPCRRHTQTTHA